MNLKYKFVYIIIICTIVFSCKKFVEIKPAPNLIATSTVFTNNSTAISAANGVYVDLSLGTFAFSNAGVSILAALSADEITNSTPNSMYDPFVSNSLLENDNSINSFFWSKAYKSIYRVNSILEGLETSSSLDSSLRNQLMGEMKFVRAFNYSYLINLFGDVPLITSTDYITNSTSPRTSIALIYQQIVKDLSEAQDLLKPAYPTAGKARPNKWAATALLARVYLYLKEWTKAEEYSSSIISSNSYSLVSNPNNVFLKTNTETIWEFAPVRDLIISGPGPQFSPPNQTSLPPFVITTDLYNSFETNDSRKSSWLGKNVVTTNGNSVSYYYPAKQKQRSGTPINEYNIVFRLAEQYLIRAEARAEQDKLTEAISDLNMIRSRAGLTSLSNTLSKNDVLAAVMQERRVELFAEWGHRWFDIKRRGLANSIMAAAKGSNWQSTDMLYPIPFNELQYNTYLIQNPGY